MNSPRRTESTPGDAAGDHSAGSGASQNRAQTAEDIGVKALALADQARTAGLATLAFLLEAAALEAGAGHWLGDRGAARAPE
jgi:hypothetical protein